MFSRDLLKGKRILVTGGGTGLGKEISLGFAAHGAHVFICGRRPDVLDQAAGEIRARSGGQADALVANVRDPDSIEKMMADIWATGPLTGLVNNAGANFLAPTETLSPRGYEAIRSTIMDGSFYAAQGCGKRWIAAGLPGVIISNLDELRNLMIFLMSDGCSYITGDTISIDGGHHLAAPSTFAGLAKLSQDDWQRAREAIQASTRKEKQGRSA